MAKIFYATVPGETYMHLQEPIVTLGEERTSLGKDPEWCCEDLEEMVEGHRARFSDRIPDGVGFDIKVSDTDFMHDGKWSRVRYCPFCGDYVTLIPHLILKREEKVVVVPEQRYMIHVLVEVPQPGPPPSFWHSLRNIVTGGQ